MRFGGREYKTPAHLVKEAAAGVNTPYSHAFPRRKGCILFPVFGGEKAAAKIRTVKGLRVEIFSRCARKNTTRPLTVRIVGADEIFRLRGEKAVEKFKKLCKN